MVISVWPETFKINEFLTKYFLHFLMAGRAEPLKLYRSRRWYDLINGNRKYIAIWCDYTSPEVQFLRRIRPKYSGSVPYCPISYQIAK